MSNIIRFGLDLAKNSFVICGIDENGHIVLRKTLNCSRLLGFFANTPPALVAMEAGSGAHHWARELAALGHDARIIDPRLVAPYRTGKNDLNDALAICEAAGRPAMRFVPVKTVDQQAILLIHRLRRKLCHRAHPHHQPPARLLAEFGIVAPKSVATFKARSPGPCSPNITINHLPETCRSLMQPVRPPPGEPDERRGFDKAA